MAEAALLEAVRALRALLILGETFAFSGFGRSSGSSRRRNKDGTRMEVQCSYYADFQSWSAHYMRAQVLGGLTHRTWEAGPPSAAELKEAAVHFDRSAALCDAPAWKAQRSTQADRWRRAAAFF